MNAAELLSSKGVSMQQASDWVQARLDRPGEIFSICLEFGINSTMLAEIVQPFVPGVARAMWKHFLPSWALMHCSCAMQGRWSRCPCRPR